METGVLLVSMPRNIPRSMLGCAECAECAGLADVSGSIQTRPESTDLPDARRGVPFGRFGDPVRERAWIGQSGEDGYNQPVGGVVEASEVRQLFVPLLFPRESISTVPGGLTGSSLLFPKWSLLAGGESGRAGARKEQPSAQHCVDSKMWQTLLWPLLSCSLTNSGRCRSVQTHRVRKLGGTARPREKKDPFRSQGA
jgi:hypothetical protein